MNKDRSSGQPPPFNQPQWTQIDFEWAAALKDATHAPDVPAGLYRPVRYGAALSALVGGMLTIALGIWGFFVLIYPPELVREAMVHERRDATLRGDFRANSAHRAGRLVRVPLALR